MNARVIDRLEHKGFVVRHITSPVDFLKAWNALMVPSRDPVVALNDPIVSLWLDRYDNIHWVPDDGGRDRVLSASVGFTGASFALEETGTVVLAENSGYARLVSNMVPTHVTLIPENRVVANWEALLRDMRQHAAPIPRILSFISGPSQTADIQGTLVRGMHGPLHVEAWIVPPVEDQPPALT